MGKLGFAIMDIKYIGSSRAGGLDHGGSNWGFPRGHPRSLRRRWRLWRIPAAGTVEVRGLESRNRTSPVRERDIRGASLEDAEEQPVSKAGLENAKISVRKRYNELCAAGKDHRLPAFRELTDPHRPKVRSSFATQGNKQA